MVTTFHPIFFTIKDDTLGRFTQAISKMVKPWVDALKLIHKDDTLGSFSQAVSLV